MQKDLKEYRSLVVQAAMLKTEGRDLPSYAGMLVREELKRLDGRIAALEAKILAAVDAKSASDAATSWSIGHIGPPPVKLPEGVSVGMRPGTGLHKLIARHSSIAPESGALTIIWASGTKSTFYNWTLTATEFRDGAKIGTDVSITSPVGGHIKRRDQDGQDGQP